MANFSSRGPTRTAASSPTSWRPGTHIQGAASQDPGLRRRRRLRRRRATGSPHVAGLALLPGGQTLYTWSSGTSHVDPGRRRRRVAGLQLLRPRAQPGRRPSPAMLKALLLNSPRYLDGAGTAADRCPSNRPGLGRRRRRARSSTARTARSWRPGHLLTATGQDLRTDRYRSRTTRAVPRHAGLDRRPRQHDRQRLRERPRPRGDASAGSTYKGNVFSGAHSHRAASPTPATTSRTCSCPAGTAGAFTVRVIARNARPATACRQRQPPRPGLRAGDLQRQHHAGAALDQARVTTSDAAGNDDGVVDRRDDRRPGWRAEPGRRARPRCYRCACPDRRERHGARRCVGLR